MKASLAACMSSKESVVGTPWSLYRRLDRIFDFTLDAAANRKNRKCILYLGPGSILGKDALAVSWEGHNVWLNYPYGRGKGMIWLKKAFEEGQKPNTLVVVLAPSRTSNPEFHKFAMKAHAHIYIKGRIVFEGCTLGAPFPSVLYVFKKTKRKSPKIYSMVAHPKKKSKNKS